MISPSLGFSSTPSVALPVESRNTSSTAVLTRAITQTQPGPDIAATDLSTWDVQIEDWHAPEDLFDIDTGTVITLHNFIDQELVPWTNLGAGFENASGMGRVYDAVHCSITPLQQHCFFRFNHSEY